MKGEEEGGGKGGGKRSEDGKWRTRKEEEGGLDFCVK